MADLHLVGVVDPATHERTGTPLPLAADDLTTHGSATPHPATAGPPVEPLPAPPAA